MPTKPAPAMDPFPRDALEEEEGVWNPNICAPKSILPFVKFIICHYEIWVQEGRGPGGVPPAWCAGQMQMCAVLVTRCKHTSAQEKPCQWYHRRLSAPVQ